MHTVFRLTLEDALVMLEAAEQEARRIGVKQTICVADDGAHPIALHRMTGARLTGVEIAIAKAFTAAGHQRDTHLFNEPPNGPALPGNEAFGISHMHPGRFAVFVGGFPIVHEGQVVGAVGVSGGNGEQDKAVGAAALRAFREKVAAPAPNDGEPPHAPA
ncbi:heme-binding protein [Nonomuraea sp. C10]|uniref:GlcG/HbpS family heme-binding protein n=1 Tax=Nonomuraea sp. C10 TaxID=2600577 RepID=UPI0011CE3AE1|nr:heme-binding protein [Nonomuraea sp. C10]TXK42353.1 heme-binding protein [Nonomuraea sp. C10]